MCLSASQNAVLKHGLIKDFLWQKNYINTGLNLNTQLQFNSNEPGIY